MTELMATPQNVAEVQATESQIWSSVGSDQSHEKWRRTEHIIQLSQSGLWPNSCTWAILWPVPGVASSVSSFSGTHLSSAFQKAQVHHCKHECQRAMLLPVIFSAAPDVPRVSLRVNRVGARS